MTTKDQAIALALQALEWLERDTNTTVPPPRALVIAALNDAQKQTAAFEVDEATLIAKGWRLQDCKVCGESASAYVSPPAPDCRTCINYAHDEDHPQCKLWNGCTNGDQYIEAPAVVLWRTE